MFSLRESVFDIVNYHLFGGASEMTKHSQWVTARIFVDWFYSFYRNFYLMGVLLDVVVAVAFTIFAILYSHQDANTAPGHRGIVIALITVPCFANLLGILCSFSVLRYSSQVRDPNLSVPWCLYLGSLCSSSTRCSSHTHASLAIPPPSLRSQHPLDASSAGSW